MRTIRANCPICTDEVDLAPHEITLHLVDPALRSGEAGRYGFRCPSCGSFAVKDAGRHAVELLIEGGVELSTDPVAPWDETPEPHPEDPPGGPPLTYDDLIDLHFRLQDPHWFEQLKNVAA